MEAIKRCIGGAARGVLAPALALAGALGLGPGAQPAAAQPDLCGCEGHPESLGRFDASDAATFPPGTTSAFRSRTIPLPPDGVLVFDSFLVRHTPGEVCCVSVTFTGNDANTPVTLLVSGDVTVEGSHGISLVGAGGSGGSGGAAGLGGLGGHGAFRGGDGAYQLGNGESEGGEGFGPAGGTAGTASPLASGGGGGPAAALELRPLLGGSGGGGGASSSASSGCAGGGGGGGGGAMLIAANGTIRVDGTITADGGGGGGPGNGSCASGGGGGSGGSIRLVAGAITGGGQLFARGAGPNGAPGIVRLETPANSFPAGNTNPVAQRLLVPGPAVDPLAASVAIAAVNGEPVPQPPQGAKGGIDVFVPAPGLVTVDVASQGVPGGTSVELRAKPRLGGAALATSAALGSCDGEGRCSAVAAFDLAAGAYVLEAEATFQTP